MSKFEEARRIIYRAAEAIGAELRLSIDDWWLAYAHEEENSLGTYCYAVLYGNEHVIEAVIRPEAKRKTHYELIIDDTKYLTADREE